MLTSRGIALATLVMAVIVGDRGTQGPTLEGLSFMTGCWTGLTAGGVSIEEHYTTPSRNVMLGTTRYLQNGATRQFEFTLIEQTNTAILLTPYPRGRRSADSFRLTSLEDDRAVFEAPEHDYPKRIMYQRRGLDSLLARIDGGPTDSEGRGWDMQRAGCP